MADKSFGVKELNLLNASGTPTVTSPNNLNLNANTVAISTSATVGNNLTVSGQINVGSNIKIGNAGVVTATSFVGSGANLTGISAGISTDPSNVQATWKLGGGSGSGFTFTGPGQDGSEGNPDIYLVRGQRYLFDNTTLAGNHPFEFRNAANDADYTDGVSGAQNGLQYINVQHDAPAALKYRCTIHTSSMLGNIYIVGQHLANGANNRVLTATSAYGINAESNLTWDGSAMAVGHSNPSDTLHVYHATDNLVARFESGDTGGGITLKDNTHVTSLLTTNGAFEINVDQGGDISGETIALKMSGSEKLRITSGGSVNIGDDFSQTTYKTQIEATDQNVLRLVTDSDDANGVELVLRKDSASPADNDNIGNIYFQGNDDSGASTFYASMEAYSDDVSNNSENGYIRFRTRNNGSMGERLRIFSNGSVGVGDYSSTNLGHAFQALRTSGSTYLSSKNTGGNAIFYAEASNGNTAKLELMQAGTGNFTLEVGSDNALMIKDDGSERLRINSSGTLFMGKTSQSSGTAGVELYADGPNFMTRNGTTVLGLNNDAGTNGDIMRFYFQDVHKGSLNFSSGSFSATTASDYRLKENDTPITDGIARVKKLKPIRFNFKENPSETLDGFFAHELQEVVPDCVYGEKDGEISERGEGYQCISKEGLVPLLTASIKDLIAKVETLEAEVAALKGS